MKMPNFCGFWSFYNPNYYERLFRNFIEMGEMFQMEASCASPSNKAGADST